MAEQIPYGVASSLINTLASAAFREFGRIYGVMDELEKLKTTIESIKAVLLDAEEKQEQDQAVQIWIRRFKDVLHHADDVLDEFAIEDMRHQVDAGHKSKVKEVFHSLSLKPVAFRRKMAHKIEKIRQNFNDVAQDMAKLNLSPRVVVVNQSDSVRRETSSFVPESRIIGRGDSKKEIISLLRQPHKSQNVSTVAIVGIGGLGKTALAQLVYNDVEVQNFFEKRVWICVSVNFDVKTIVKKMLESFLDSSDNDKLLLEKLSLDSLQNKLREILGGKRYLLVLDDIWNENLEKWTELETYLMCGAQDSKVLVTTRSEKVAQTMGVSVPYVLNGLTPEESWSLLKNISFRDDTVGVNQRLESIGRKIAEKCRGVPLAIRTLGGLLKSKSKESEWINVLQGDFWKLCKDENSIIPVLKLSYQNLSPQLRQCFAYCSLYPKDWKIEKDELIQLWMAQGYLECSTENQLMEDVGNQFVKIFLMKSFFQDAEMNEDDEIVSFKMHDLMHDLAMLAAGNDCCYSNIEAKRLVGSPMHVSLEPNAVSLLGSLDASKLRTLILLSSNEKEVYGEELSVVSNFKCLRVLMLSYSSLSKLSDSIGKLKHLRYLSLWNCSQLTSLSKCIGTLVCLQTLELYMCEKLEFSTKAASKLLNLRHLLFGTRDKTQVGLGKMNARQYQGVIYSNWLSSLTNIVEITLSGCQSCRYLPPLERLPYLKSLETDYLDELECIHFEEGLLVTTSFPSLERLSFRGCEKFQGWCKMGDDVNCSHHLSLPSLPRLSQLSIRNCPKLTRMPAFPNLDKRLELECCPGETLEATINTAASKCSDDYCAPLSMLKSLSIIGILGIEEIPKHWMQNLTSLEDLKFSDFGSREFQRIEIWFEDDLNYLPSLQTITLRWCPDLIALPDWICNLSSLQHIKVYKFPNLKRLSERMPRLTNLQTLEIIGCHRILIEEYQTETSPFRSHIAHIPNIILKP